jgi:DNA primase
MPHVQTSRFDPTEIQNLKAQIDMFDLAESLLGPGDRTGRILKYHSPFRSGDSDPSLVIYPDGYYDFGTGEYGDQIALVRRVKNLDFPSALRWLQTYGGHPYQPSRQLSRTLTIGVNEPPTAEWQQKAEAEIQRAEDILWHKPEILNYLIEKRGFTPETIRQFRLGYNPTLRRTKCLNQEGDPAYLPAGIVIPITATGALWGVHVRSITGNLAEWLGVPDQTDTKGKKVSKYKYLAGSKASGSLFNGDAIAPGKPVLFVEGEFDAMLGQQELGDTVAVVTLGGASNRLAHRWLTPLQAAGRIFLALDNDGPGQKAKQHLEADFGSRATHLPVPAGKDLTDFVVKHQGDVKSWFTAALGAAQCPFLEGLPDSWRVLLLKAAGTAAPVFELIIELLRAGKISPNQISRPVLQRLGQQIGWNLSTRFLSENLHALQEMGYLQISTPEKPINTGGENGKKSTNGRPEKVYKLVIEVDLLKQRLLQKLEEWLRQKYFPHKDQVDRQGNITIPATCSDMNKEMFMALGQDEQQARSLAEQVNSASKPAYLKQARARQLAQERLAKHRRRMIASLEETKHTALLPDWPISNLHTYKVALLRTWKLTGGIQETSKGFWADRLDIDRGTVNKYVREAGFQIEPNLVERPLETSGDVSQQVAQLRDEERAFTRALRYVHPDGTKQATVYTEENARLLLKMAQAKGGQVLVELQKANLHIFDSSIKPRETIRRSTDGGSAGTGRSILRTTDTHSRRQLGTETSGYRRAWVRGQLLLRLKVMEQNPALLLADPETGEIRSEDSITIDELLSLLLGYTVKLSAPIEEPDEAAEVVADDIPW